MQLRLAIGLSLAILIVAAAAALFAFTSAFEEAHEMQDDTLRQVAMLLDRQQVKLSDEPNHDRASDHRQSRFTVRYLGTRVTSQQGTDSALALPADLADGISTLMLGGERFRVLVLSTQYGERIAVAQEMGARDKDARESAWRSLVPFFVLLPVLLWVVGHLVRKLFKPIAYLSAEIDGRAEQALHPIDEQHVPREIRPFVVAINRLLGRVEQSIEVQSRFVADAAHELRSPLTALSLQAERLAELDLAPEAQRRLAPLQRGIERGRQLIDQLLALTRAQTISQRPALPHSVHDVFRRVLEDLMPLAEAKKIDIGVEGSADIKVAIDDMDLTTLIKNLVDNAIRYTPEHGRVDLSVRMCEAMACLQVCDSGPGIGLDERARVFDPFYRSLGSHEIGSGLGLSIVKTIADRVGGRLRLAFSDEQHQTGLCICVLLPACKS